MVDRCLGSDRKHAIILEKKEELKQNAVKQNRQLVKYRRVTYNRRKTSLSSSLQWVAVLGHPEDACVTNYDFVQEPY